MPPGSRPPKRPGDQSESPHGHKVKLPKLERDPEDFSSVVKSKLQSFSRTGQACDRCKVRKIRCDALPQGCSHCTNQNLECFVTDRVTGRTERRGYMIELEQEKTDMMNHIRALEKVLEQNGVEVRPYQWSPFANNYPPGVTFDAMGKPSIPDQAAKNEAQQWSQVGSAWVKSHPTQLPVHHQHQLASFADASALESRPGGNTHLGVAADSSPLSAIKGTKLSILGATIDITAFAAPDMDEPPPNSGPRVPLYNKSVQAFLQSTMHINPPVAGVKLPPRSDAFEYSEWYFLMVYPFMPVLHKPSYLALLTRHYDDPSYVATTSELVVVHMVFASIYFQYGVRNREDPEKQTRLNDLSNQHYHWCLEKVFEITLDNSLTAVQALVLLGAHMRGFPKPGCAFYVVQHAYNKAIELNLHRSSREGSALTLESQMRSRAWWCMLTLGVTLNGRLGRPMPTILEEFDVPFPVAIPDEYLTPEGITDRSRIGQCPYNVGLVGHKIVPLYMEMYTSLYSVRRDPRKHEETVARLEEQLKAWKDALPDELRPENTKASNTQMFALYTQQFALEFRLCLRHPSICPSTDPRYQAENTRICEETARELLKHLIVILKLKSLDTTWYQLSVYVAAVFCTLVSNWERRYHITQEEVDTLKREMGMWLSIISEIGHLLGSRAGLCDDVSRIINNTIGWIQRDMGRGLKQTNGTPPAPPHAQQHPQATPQHQHFQPSAPTTNGSTPSDSSANCNSAPNTYYDAAAAAYQQLAGYGDQGTVVTNGAGPDPDAVPGSAVLGSGPGQYDPNSMYGSTQANAGTDPQSAQAPAQNPLVAFASQAEQLAAAVNNSAPHHHHNTQQQPAVGGGSWQDWTAAIAAGAQEQYSATNALLNLGAAAGAQQSGQQHNSVSPQPPPPGREDVVVASADVTAGAGLAEIANAAAMQWPLLMFSDGASAGGGGGGAP